MCGKMYFRFGIIQPHIDRTAQSAVASGFRFGEDNAKRDRSNDVAPISFW